MLLSLLFVDVQYNNWWLLENRSIQKTTPTIKAGVCIKKNTFSHIMQVSVLVIFIMIPGFYILVN